MPRPELALRPRRVALVPVRSSGITLGTARFGRRALRDYLDGLTDWPRKMAYPRIVSRSISLAIVSCNADPESLEIMPISRARRVSIESCSATYLNAAASALVIMKSAWRPRLVWRVRFQYRG